MARWRYIHGSRADNICEEHLDIEQAAVCGMDGRSMLAMPPSKLNEAHRDLPIAFTVILCRRLCRRARSWASASVYAPRSPSCLSHIVTRVANVPWKWPRAGRIGAPQLLAGSGPWRKIVAIWASVPSSVLPVVLQQYSYCMLCMSRVCIEQEVYSDGSAKLEAGLDSVDCNLGVCVNPSKIRSTGPIVHSVRDTGGSSTVQ